MIRSISGQYFDPLGSMIPSFVVYVPYSGGGIGDVATISVPAIEPRARDYAKELLDRVRYLRDTYVTPYDPSGVAPTPQAFNDAESFIRLLPLNRTQMSYRLKLVTA